MMGNGLGRPFVLPEQPRPPGQAIEDADPTVVQQQKPGAGAGGLLAEQNETWCLHLGTKVDPMSRTIFP
jgi:hypothetical protein